MRASRLLLSAGLGALLAWSPVAGADGWTSTAGSRSGTLTSARSSATFVALDAAGTGGTRYTATKSVGAVTEGVVDLRSTSTTVMVLTGTIALESFLVSTTVAADSCSVAWRGSACDGTTTSVLPSTVLLEPRQVRWSAAPVAAGAAVHLRFTVGGSIGNTLTATVALAPGRPGADRTRG